MITINHFIDRLGRCLILFNLTIIFITEGNLSAQPAALREDISIKELATVNTHSVRIRQDPASGNLYVLQNDGVISRVNFGRTGTATLTTVYQTRDHGLVAPLGMTFAKDGTMFLVGNEGEDQLGTATIVKGIPDTPGSETRSWSIIAKTVEYLYGFTYNHRMSGVVVNLKGDYIYINSGARTDHGEVRENYREVGLTSIILKLPVSGDNITLEDDRDWLLKNGYLFAEGIRNDFDFAYAGNGDLFSVENSGDRDDPEEMNWIQEGKHYGFPWRIGGNDTPQQFPDYDPHKDPLLSPNAWGGGNLYATFSNDPDYPPPPEGITFSEPVQNMGPDADRFRDPQTGEVKDASELGVLIPTFTTHRSPDGIVFDKDSLLTDDLAGGAFVISLNNGALLKALGDEGEDLLHMALINNGDKGYSAKTTRLVSGFHAPLGIELVDNQLYVLETGLWASNSSPKLWQITLPLKTTAIDHHENLTIPASPVLRQNYPNPFNLSTTIHYGIPNAAKVRITILDLLGREIFSLVNRTLDPGEYSTTWNGINNHGQIVTSGVYVMRMQVAGRNYDRNEFVMAMKMILLK